MAVAIISRKDALAQGLSRYFTGVPCRRGHIAERIASKAACSICVSENDRKFKEDNRHKIRAQENERNLKPENRVARLARRAKWRESNIEKLRLAGAKRRELYPERIKESSRKHYWNDPEKGRTRVKKWALSNPVLKKKYYEAVGKYKNKEYREANRAELKAYYARWQKENKDRVYASIHKRRALKKKSNGAHTAADITEILKAQQHLCPYCTVSLKRIKRHIDHILPLKLGGSNNKDNIQILCVPCNLSKGAKHPNDFARSLGLLL